MHRHLIAVKVRIKCGADQRVQLQGLALDENGFKGLDSQPVQGRGAVEKDRVFFDDFVQGVPDFRNFALHHFFGALDRGYQAFLLEPIINKRFKKLQRHLFRQSTLMKSQIRSYRDNGTTGIINPFSQQILTKTSLLALQGVTERF